MTRQLVWKRRYWLLLGLLVGTATVVAGLRAAHAWGILRYEFVSIPAEACVQVEYFGDYEPLERQDRVWTNTYHADNSWIVRCPVQFFQGHPPADDVYVVDFDAYGERHWVEEFCAGKRAAARLRRIQRNNGVHSNLANCSITTPGTHCDWDGPSLEIDESTYSYYVEFISPLNWDGDCFEWASAAIWYSWEL